MNIKKIENRKKGKEKLMKAIFEREERGKEY